MSDPRDGERIKIAVREGYAQRLQTGSCCGPATGPASQTCGCGTLPALGYSEAEIDGLPRGATANAFGCGNPAAFSDVREGEVVLDIGSGAGIDCLIAGRRVGPSGRVIGLDMTEAMIEAARGNARAAGAANVEFRLGDAEAMPVDNASVDWVISNCVINLAPDKRKVFREVARVLKPGGRVAISDIVFADDAPDLPPALAADPELVVGCIAGAIRESGYLQAMREAGLADVAVTDRMRYSGDTVRAFFRETLERLGTGDRRDAFLAALPDDLAGKVWSARIVARKPGLPPASGAASPTTTIEQAVTADVSAVEDLLNGNGLPAAGVRQGIERFLVARSASRVVGCVGLELFGGTALLRSLAVLPEYRGRGLGARLAGEILALARRLGAREAVLLTTTVEAMAAALGFEPVAREALPAAVRASWEFRADCCHAATCMRKDLGSGAGGDARESERWPRS